MSYAHIPDAAAELEIPDEGTLSRTLYEDSQVKVVVFGFDTDQELSEHTAAVPAVIQVMRGHLRLELDGDTVEAGPGSWTHMPARLPHAVHATEPTVMLLTLLGAAP